LRLAELECALLDGRKGSLRLELLLGVHCTLHLVLMLVGLLLSLLVKRLRVGDRVLNTELKSCVCRILTPLGIRLLESVALKSKLILGDGILRLECNLKSGFVLLGLIGEGLGLDLVRFFLDDVSEGVHVTDF
jgi:hypothetical protein